jgi:hypothetical protein
VQGDLFLPKILHLLAIKEQAVEHNHAGSPNSRGWPFQKEIN